LKIAILGWGSLIWDPKGLPTNGEWQLHGPRLPIEFSRISDDGRVTLVIDADHGGTVSTRYIQSSRTDLGDAVCDLRCRENTVRKHIGFVDLPHKTSSITEFPDHEAAYKEIHKWLTTSGFDAVVWTALPSNFKNFSIPDAIQYLDALPEAKQLEAFKYINRAPEEVMTPLRTRLSELGKVHSEEKS
jgi:hypothetical protein